jgi:hypothetical protein
MTDQHEKSRRNQLLATPGVQDGALKPRPGRTINQLHFEDLEPHRFEDLIRQLVYGFRDWVALESLGRSGADERIDIRGIERVRPTSGSSLAEADEDLDLDVGEHRTWFVQCKREKAFGPAKARAVAAAALVGASEPPFGFILAAPCDLSKKTRDTLASELRAAGVSQILAWGRGDLEDQLFLPENDHLLFAYFGISLQVRRRNQVTELRSRLAKKRQVYGAIGSLDHRGWTSVLVRDPTEAGYPFRDRVEDFDDANPPWLWTEFRGHANPDTVALIFRRYHAWVTPDRMRFDVIKTCSHVAPGRSEFDKARQRDEEACDRLRRDFHNEVPKGERAWLEMVGWIPLDDILLVDDLGDAANDPPHLLVTRDHRYGFFTDVRRSLVLDGHRSDEHIDPAALKRAKLYPDPIPEVEIPDPEWNRW